MFLNKWKYNVWFDFYKVTGVIVILTLDKNQPNYLDLIPYQELILGTINFYIKGRVAQWPLRFSTVISDFKLPFTLPEIGIFFLA
jgi:hypothetical protein